MFRQAIGSPSGLHGLFAQYRVEALSFQTSREGMKKNGIAIMRVVEGEEMSEYS